MQSEKVNQDSPKFAQEKEKIKQLIKHYEELRTKNLTILDLQAKLVTDTGNSLSSDIAIIGLEYITKTQSYLSDLKEIICSLQCILDTPPEYENWSTKEKGVYFIKSGEKMLKQNDRETY